MEVSINQIIAYFRIQIQGQYNMLTPAARVATGLDEPVYQEIQSRYPYYREKYDSIYESIEVTELKKVTNNPIRKLTDSEKSYFCFYSGYMMGIATDEKSELDEEKLSRLRKFYYELKVILDE